MSECEQIVRALAELEPVPDKDLDGEGLCQWCAEWLGHRRFLYYDALSGEPQYDVYPCNDSASHKPDCLWARARAWAEQADAPAVNPRLIQTTDTGLLPPLPAFIRRKRLRDVAGLGETPKEGKE